MVTYKLGGTEIMAEHSSLNKQSKIKSVKWGDSTKRRGKSGAVKTDIGGGGQT